MINFVFLEFDVLILKRRILESQKLSMPVDHVNFIILLIQKAINGEILP